MTVAIRRCVLRVRRFGGWSWGPAPEALLAAATGALPRLVANAVDEARGDARPGASGTIDAPVRLRVVVSVDELAAIAAGHPGAAAARMKAELGRQLTAAIATNPIRTGPDDDRAPTADARAEPVDAGDVCDPRASPDGLIALLAAWQREGTLLEIASTLPAETLAEWFARLAGETTVVAGLADLDLPDRHAPALAAARDAIARTATGDVASPIARWLVAIAAAADAALRLDRAVPLPVLAAIATRMTGAIAREPVARVDAECAPSRVQSVAITSIAAALPFLAMVSLSRCRWLAAVAELFAPDDVAALITAVVHKTCAPPELGWRRDDRARAAVEALCGDSITDAYVHAASPRIIRLAGAIVAPLRAELRRGHTRGTPLLLHRHGELVALFDTAGMFPICVATDAADAIAAARGLGDLVLVPAATATPAILDRLDLANLTFVTDAPAGRGEPWRVVPASRLWTNDGGAQIARRAALAPVLADSTALADELLDALEARPALPRGPAALEAIATHAAALALGDLAHTLFGSRETATPMLALERFASLDAKVEVQRDRIDVAIPLGRRHSDLLAHGYLTTIPSWLGRVIAIHGG